MAWQVPRNTVMLIVGLGLLIYEALAGTDRPYLIAAAVTLCGLPFALHLDSVRRNGGGNGSKGGGGEAK